MCRFGGRRSRDTVPNRGVAGAIRRIRRWERAEALGASPVEPWKESRERGEPWNHESPGAGNHLTGWTLWTENEEAVLRSGGDGSRHLERDLHTLPFGADGRDAAPSSEREMERPLRKLRCSTRGMKLVTELVRWFRPVPRGIGEEKRSPEDGLERDRRKRPPAAALCRGDRWTLRYTAPSETRGSRDFEEAMSARDRKSVV